MSDLKNNIIVANVAVIDEDGCTTSTQLWPEFGTPDAAVRTKVVAEVQRWAGDGWHKNLTGRCPVVVCFIRLDESRETIITTVEKIGQLEEQSQLRDAIEWAFQAPKADGPYTIEPAPRRNPEGRLDEAWRIVKHGTTPCGIYETRDAAEAACYRRNRFWASRQA